MDSHLRENQNSIRVGAVRYLNARPLTYSLSQIAPQTELIFDVPSRLADGLQSGNLDVAMIPSVEYLRGPGYSVISDACIACQGPVRSVKLFSRVPFDKIHTLALDEGSRTSAVLVQILLREEFHIQPEICQLPIIASETDVVSDAALLIGDRGIPANHDHFNFVWDIGERWTQWTGLPFVFAMWIARPNFNSPGFESLLSSTRDRGVQQIPEIARREAANYSLSTEECLIYLRDRLHFFLGSREKQGLNLFKELAKRHGFVPAGA